MERLLVLLIVAVSLAAVDLWVKFAVPTQPWALHQRSDVWFIGSCFLLLASLALARLPSNTVTIAAGIFNGGILGNLMSASTDHLEVPNPILIGQRTGGVAFNLADAFILTGNLMLMVSLCVLTIRYRDHLPRRQGLRLTRSRQKQASA
jgi:lipoprotein signal peptidase